MNKLLKNKKGITLIALLVTIVILLILTAVTMTMVLGDNGIIKQAEKASSENQKQSIKETISLSMCSLIMQKNSENKNEKITKEQLDNQLIQDGLTEYEISGADNFIIKINNTSYIVKQTGEVLENNIQSILKKGDYINYISDSLSGGENWRVFYRDGNEVNIVTTNPTEIIQATNNNVTEESEEKTKEFEKLLRTKRTEPIVLKVGRDPIFGDKIVEKSLNYYSNELAKYYSLTVTMDDIKKATGINYTIGENVSYNDLKAYDQENLFPLSEECYLISTYYGNLSANKNSLYMMFSNKGGIGACWLLQSAFKPGTKIRPIVTLKENLEITGGDGTIQSPYTLKQI